MTKMATHLKFGLTTINYGYNSYPERMALIARAAENAGFDSLWVGGHPFLSEKQTRMQPSLRILDPIIALTFVAAYTKKIRLGTGILLLPQFNPVIAAKQLASLDVLSEGRLTVGIGVGWSEHEYQVLGIPFQDRGSRADDYLKAMKALWSQDKPVYPAEARRSGVRGTVTFSALIGKDGKLRDVELLSGPLALYAASRAAVMKWEYEPTRVDGASVEVSTTLGVNVDLSH